MATLVCIAEWEGGLAWYHIGNGSRAGGAVGVHKDPAGLQLGNQELCRRVDGRKKNVGQQGEGKPVRAYQRAPGVRAVALAGEPRTDSLTWARG
jgi:hypothetical protein